MIKRKKQTWPHHMAIWAICLAVTALCIFPIVGSDHVAAAAKVKLNAKNLQLSVAQTKTLKVSNQPSGAKVTFTSSNRKVAKVNARGLVTAVNAGSAKITVKVKTQRNKKSKSRTYKLTAKVTVTKPQLSLEEVNLSDLEYESVSLRQPIKGAKVTWKSSDTKILTLKKGVDAWHCVLDPKKPGTVNLTATVKTKKIPTLASRTLTYQIPVTVTGGNITWELQNGVLVLQGSGDMTDFLDPEYAYHNGYQDERYARPKWSEEASSIRKVIIEEGITSVGSNAFIETPSLCEVQFPSTMQRIGYGAFADCSLRKLQIPEGVTVLTSAFSGNETLQSVQLPQSLTSIDSGGCAWWMNLEELTVPDGVTSIGARAFQGDGQLKRLHLPESLRSIGDNAFEGCISVEEMIIPQGTVSIGNHAFEYCNSLQDVYFPASLTEFGKDLFLHRSSAVTIHAPAGSPAEQYALEHHLTFMVTDTE